MAPILGYWKMRGWAQSIRLLLNYVGEEYEDKFYECGPAPDFSWAGWLKDKESLPLDFPNLPYYIDGDVKISQSHAILRHIARKHDLCGSTEAESIAVDMTAEECLDFRGNFASLCYHGGNLKTPKDQYLKDVVIRLERYEKFLGDKNWFAGDKITFPDFEMYEIFDHHRVFQSTILDNFPKITAFLHRFEELPAIKKFMSSDRCLKKPLYNRMAEWRGD